jgi:hypothetical protein
VLGPQQGPGQLRLASASSQPWSSGARARAAAIAITGSDGRWSWEVLPRSRVDDRTFVAAIAEAIAARQPWRREYETAKAARAGPTPPASAA